MLAASLPNLSRETRPAVGWRVVDQVHGIAHAHTAARPWREDVVLAVMAALESHFKGQEGYPRTPIDPPDVAETPAFR